MLTVDRSGLPSASAVALVARSSATRPDFVLCDRDVPRVTAARWHRRRVQLDGPVEMQQHLLSYCEKGGALSTVVRDGVRWRARQHTGSITFLPAGCYQRWELEAPSEVAHLHLYIAPDALVQQAPHVVMGARDPWFDAFFRLLAVELGERGVDGRLERLDLVDRLDDLVMQRLGLLQCHRSAGTKIEDMGRVQPLRPALLRAVLQYIDESLGERLRLHSLAGIASMSVDHFARAFERATGSTPHRWILQCRLDEACRRLAAGGEPVEEISHACGFAGAAHFSATFRRHVGVTPTEYRRRR